MTLKALSFLALGVLAAQVAGSGQTQGTLSSRSSAAEGAGTLEAGKAVYEQHCAQCHGVNGDGNGPATVWLFPRPRNFSAGLFKIQSTPAGTLPTDEDLYQTVTRGMPGTSMPSFTYLSEAERRAVVQYVKYLTAYTNDAGQRINRFEEARQKNNVGKPYQVPPEPAVTVQSLARGQELFSKLLCVTCHGETGAGDGPNAPTLRDTQGLYLPPRDFNTGAFRGGSTGRDLYLRIATGLAGTPMAPYGPEAVSETDRWALVHYVLSLRRKDVEINDILAPGDDLIRAPKVGRALPIEPTDPFWETMDPVRVPLNPLWPEKDLIYAVSVRAVHDGQRVAILCQWRDPVVNGAPVRVQDFQDAVALQFSLDGTPPFLGMGDAQHPVNIWQWKAGWQQEMEAERPDVHTLYAAMHSDVYFETAPLYRTAEAAGNLLAQRKRASPVEDANARGFGTMTAQPARGQNVQGKGLWRDGHWSVVFVRGLKSREADDVQFVKGRPVPVAFAVWDGYNRDRNGRKVVSNWWKLRLE